MSQVGYIYLASDPKTRFIKIGFSKSPQRRIAQLNSQTTLLPYPHSFRLITAFRGTLQEEQRLHRIFAARRVRGEWFNLCQWRYMDIVVAFERREPLPECYIDAPDESAPFNPWEYLANKTHCMCEECV